MVEGALCEDCGNYVGYCTCLVDGLEETGSGGSLC